MKLTLDLRNYGVITHEDLLLLPLSLQAIQIGPYFNVQEFFWPPYLSYLDWDLSRYTGDIAAALATLRRLPLVHLGVKLPRGTPLPDLHIESLRSLDVSHNNLEHLETTMLGQLQILDVACNNLSDIEAITSTIADSRCVLEHLNLSYNPVVNLDRFWEAMKINTSIKHLNICGCSVVDLEHLNRLVETNYFIQDVESGHHDPAVEYLLKMNRNGRQCLRESPEQQLYLLPFILANGDADVKYFFVQNMVT